MSVFKDVDMIIYGHNHREAGLHRKNGILLLNPGSPTDTRQPYSSMATLLIGNMIDVRMTQWRNHGEGRKKPTYPKAGGQKAESKMAKEKPEEG
jgi:predicted phosphodiesterase